MRGIIYLLFVPLGCLGCSDDEASATPCTPGQVLVCMCSDGSPGKTTCLPGGAAVGPCTGCATDGGAGAGGTGGTGGVGGWPATGGTGATAGEAGSGATGGSAGSAGSAGSGGTGAGGYTPEPGGPAHPPSAVFPHDPTPDGYSIVQQVAAERPDWLLESCVADGGNNEFLFEVVRRLRAQDTRWGLNWKRGVVGDLSQDVVDYHYGADPSEGSTNVYIVDMITGHCGPDPQPGWIDVTQATLEGNTVGMWTLAGQDLGP